MLEALRLAVGLALPWLLGIALLYAVGWPRGDASTAGTLALRVGYGHFLGVLLLTFWMRGLSAIGIAFSVWSIGLPLAMATGALLVFTVRSQRLQPAALRTAAIALYRPELPRWQRVVWLLLIAWLTLRFALLGAEVAWQPLYPWDAWIQWATKARVWYELGRIAPFVRADVWVQGASGAYFDAAPHYPATVPLLQVWSSIALGHWDDSAMNWPWPLMLVALTVTVYGVFASAEVPPLGALVGAYLVASLPLLDVHAALAGYADLPMAATYTLAALALYRWAITRDVGDLLLALLLALACPLIKRPGIVWALTLLPGVLIVLWPRRGMRLVGMLFAAAALGLMLFARTEPVILGYRLHLDFRPEWIALGDGYFMFGNWNLLWYGVIALAVLGWRHLREAPLSSLAVVVAAGLGFLAVVFGFTNAAAWVADQTTLNRATLHIAPLLVCLGVLLAHRLASVVPSRMPSASVAIDA